MNCINRNKKMVSECQQTRIPLELRKRLEDKLLPLGGSWVFWHEIDPDIAEIADRGNAAVATTRPAVAAAEGAALASAIRPAWYATSPCPPHARAPSTDRASRWPGEPAAPQTGRRTRRTGRATAYRSSAG